MEIAKNRTLCDEWMNQYPTIFISFRQVDGLDFTGAYDMLTWVISELYKKHLYLLESDRINECDTLYNPKAKPISYWKNTSDNAIIRSFIDYAGSNITKKLETLMAGGCIVQRVDENLTYDYLHSSEDNLWSMLYLTGYLTRAREDDYPDEIPEGMVAFMILSMDAWRFLRQSTQKF